MGKDYCWARKAISWDKQINSLDTQLTMYKKSLEIVLNSIYKTNKRKDKLEQMRDDYLDFQIKEMTKWMMK
jgi:hypothetical protein